jgi:hypothetical protein
MNEWEILADSILKSLNVLKNTPRDSPSWILIAQPLTQMYANGFLAVLLDPTEENRRGFRFLTDALQNEGVIIQR